MKSKFDFWWEAYLAALPGLLAETGTYQNACRDAAMLADESVKILDDRYQQQQKE